MIFGWGIGLGVLGYYLFDIYNTFFQRDVDLMQLFNAFPEDLMAFFGGDVDLFTPSGFLQLEFFSYMPIVLGIMVISAAASLISKDEEEGSLELIVAQPISRARVFAGRLLALILSVVLILTITWSGFALGAHQNDFDLSSSQLARPFISLFAILMVFLSLSVLLSMILPSSNSASMISGFLLIASYFISSLVNLDEKLRGINRFSPLKYYQGGTAVEGLDIQKLLLLLGISLAFLLLGMFIFEKRDLRFGGSGGFRLVFPKEGGLEK
jgi:ABC-2 type transport system permease protein